MRYAPPKIPVKWGIFRKRPVMHFGQENLIEEGLFLVDLVHQIGEVGGFFS